jgi:hypothetical protein
MLDFYNAADFPCCSSRETVVLCKFSQAVFIISRFGKQMSAYDPDTTRICHNIDFFPRNAKSVFNYARGSRFLFGNNTLQQHYQAVAQHT